MEERPFRAEGMEPVDWADAVEWWDGASEILRPRSFPRGQPDDEDLFRLDEDSDDAKRSLVYVGAYGDVAPTEENRWEILDAKGVIVRIQVVPPGEEPPFYGPVWAQKHVTVRGREGRLFEARKDQGSNVEFRTIRWEVPARGIAGAQVHFAIDMNPSFYTEAQQVDFINEMESIK